MAISPLLHALLHAEFNTSHYHNKDSEKAFYCVDCRGNSLSENEMETEHNGHRVLTTMKHTGYHCYKVQELLSLLPEIIDLSGIRIYNVNSEDVVFIRSMAKEKREADIRKPGCCFTCGREIKFRDNKPAFHCSLLCKNECTATSEELDQAMKLIVEQETLKRSLKEKRKMEQKNKGITTLRIKQGNITTAILGRKTVADTSIDTNASVGDGKKLIHGGGCRRNPKPEPEAVFPTWGRKRLRGANSNLDNTVKQKVVKINKFDIMIEFANIILEPLAPVS